MTNALTVFDEQKYGRLVRKALPVKIQTEAEYERLLEQTRFLIERDEKMLSPEEIRLLELLGMLVEQYEDNHYPIDEGTSLDTLKFLMDQDGLKHKDIWPLFGSKGIASEVLNAKRQISKSHAKRLAKRFHVTPDLFI